MIYNESTNYIGTGDYDYFETITTFTEVISKIIKECFPSLIEWKDFIKFLDNIKIIWKISPVKVVFLKIKLLFRRLLPANKIIYIKRKKNK